MHFGEELPLVDQAASLRDVLPVMGEKRFGCAGIVNRNGRLVGIFTDGDLQRAIARITPQSSICDYMTRTPKTIAPAELAAQALAFMNHHKINVLFVVDPADRVGSPIGILHLHDCLRAGLQ